MKEKKIVFRCIGGKDVGWGHVMRCLNLAHWLEAKFKIYFVIDQDDDVCAFIKERGFTVFEVAKKGTTEKSNEVVINTIIGLEPFIVVNDMLDTTAEYMQALKNKKYKIVNFDDTSTSAKLAHVLIDANKKEKEGKFLGPKYIVLNSVYSKEHKKKKATHKRVKHILISFGGTDPENLTLKTLQAINEKIPENVEIDVILGPSYKKEETLSPWAESEQVKFITDVDDLSSFLLNADVAVLSGGVTMFEALCLGVPTVVIAENKAQSKNARKMEKKGAVVYLGVGNKISVKKIMRKVTSLVDDFDHRDKLSNAGKETIDGKGIFRALEQIESFL